MTLRKTKYDSCVRNKYDEKFEVDKNFENKNKKNLSMRRNLLR